LRIGVLATPAVNPGHAGEPGLFYGGDETQLVRQAIAAGTVGLYSFLATLVLGYLVRLTIGFRVRREREVHGVDEFEHAETGYELGPAAYGGELRDAGPGRRSAPDEWAAPGQWAPGQWAPAEWAPAEWAPAEWERGQC
jgi:Amt family ammonium transporter